MMRPDNKETLTQARLHELLSYDPLTGVFVWRFTRARGAKAGGEAGNVAEDGYRRVRLMQKYYLAHRLAWFYVTGRWPEFEIDHRNGNGLDNRWENLRDATPTINQQNHRQPGKANTSGFLGASLNKRSGLWRAKIRVHGKDVALGYFKTAAAAGAEYLARKRELHEGCTI